MAQMELSTKQKTHRHGEQTCGYPERGGWGRGWERSLGLGDINYYI